MSLSHRPLSELGFRMPAEWEPHAGTFISWPHREQTWPLARLPEVGRAMAVVVRNIIEGEDIHILVNDHEMEGYARHVLKEEGADSHERIHFHEIPTDDAWIRDYGPIFVKNSAGQMLALDWGFNSWGEKYPHGRDKMAGQRAAQELGVQVIDPEMILEGGSIDVNGAGVLLTTEACLLNPNRNPKLTRSEIEERLKENLGVSEVLWLSEGIEGDDTDGHVDDITRFVSETVIVTAMDSNESDPNSAILTKNREILTATEFDILELPMPGQIITEGVRLPASYANFYFCNAGVLVPTFDTPKDEKALGILRDLVKDRPVIGIPGREIVWGLGGIHCLTQQIPL